MIADGLPGRGITPLDETWFCFVHGFLLPALLALVTFLKSPRSISPPLGFDSCPVGSTTGFSVAAVRLPVWVPSSGPRLVAPWINLPRERADPRRAHRRAAGDRA